MGTNTLTGIIPTIYTALYEVSREQVGFIPAATIDAKASAAALNQTVRSPVGVAGALEDTTPGQQPADTGATTVDYIDMTITKSKVAPIQWTGEEQLSVSQFGSYNVILANQFKDAFRKLCNAVERDLAVAAYTAASRAYGTAGTTPFGTAGDLSDFAGVLKILEDNGAPRSDLQLVLGSAAIANLRGKQSVLFKVNEAGSSDMLRDGMTSRVQSFALRNSGQIQLHTKGTGAAYQANGALALAAKTLAVDTGTGTIVAGDIITIANGTPADTNKYVVNTALSGGNVVIGGPGLLSSHVDNDVFTVGNNYTPNVAFARGALILAARAPAAPQGGDSADDVTFVQDPLSGLIFEVRVYRQYRRVKIEVGLAWGAKGHNSEHIAILMG